MSCVFKQDGLSASFQTPDPLGCCRSPPLSYLCPPHRKPATLGHAHGRMWPFLLLAATGDLEMDSGRSPRPGPRGLPLFLVPRPAIVGFGNTFCGWCRGGGDRAWIWIAGLRTKFGFAMCSGCDLGHVTSPLQTQLPTTTI